MKKVILFLLILPIFVNAQGNIDSLKAILTQSKDSVRVEVLLNLSDIYIEKSNIHALEVAENALKLSSRLDNEKLMGKSFLQLGRVLHVEGKYREALQHYKNCARGFRFCSCLCSKDRTLKS